ncbi:MAG TPA: GerMN domain-containing protein, partial [Coriobacteriia bacterium]|nr:GerMN domain-containing protein [Coriobacteriia bacterium]
MSTNHTAAGVVLALVLSACGSHGSATPSDAPSVPASGSSPSRTADACAAGEAEASDEVALLYFPCGSTGVMAAVERSVTETGDERVAQVLQLYLAGPSAEEREAGIRTMLGPGDVEIVEDPTARLVLDFPSEVNNVSTSAGSGAVLASLRQTLIGLNGIEEIELRLHNDCAAFFEWIQV